MKYGEVQHLPSKEVNGQIHAKSYIAAPVVQRMGVAFLITPFFWPFDSSEARMEYRAAAHLNGVIKKPNKRECSYPFVMLDIAPLVRRTFVCIHYSSYMKISIIVRQEVEASRRRWTYNYGVRASLSCHEHGDPIRSHMELKKYHGYAYMHSPSTSSPTMNQPRRLDSERCSSSSSYFAQNPYLNKAELGRCQMKSRQTILCVDYTCFFSALKTPSHFLVTGITHVKPEC